MAITWPGTAATRRLDRAAIFRGYPLAVRTNNGPELTSRVVHGVANTHWHQAKALEEEAVPSQGAAPQMPVKEGEGGRTEIVSGVAIFYGLFMAVRWLTKSDAAGHGARRDNDRKRGELGCAVD